MSAQIFVEQNGKQSNDYWIDRNVFRIGSASDCELRVESLPVHALTVQFANGAYRVFNRTNSPVKIGDQQLMPMEPTIWSASTAISFGTTFLSLEVDGDPSPSRKPVRVFGSEDRTSSSIRKKAKKQKKRGFDVILSCAALVAFAVLTVAFYLGQSKSIDSTDLFEALVVKLNEEESANRRARLIRERLQEARVMSLRGDRANANLIYSDLRNLLLNDRQLRADELTPAEVFAYKFIRIELQRGAD